VLVRIDENLESVELQLAQFGDDWDRARLIFVKLVRASLQKDLHLRSESRRLAARLREAEADARELLDFADAAASASILPGVGAEEQGQGEGSAGGMISRLVFEQQQALSASNERTRSLLDTLYTQRVAELKHLSARMVELEDRIAAFAPGAVDAHVDLQQYPPVVVTAARAAASGAAAGGGGGATDHEALSLPALQSELADVRALDLALDRVDQLAGAAQALLLEQTHHQALPLLLESSALGSLLMAELPVSRPSSSAWQ
jgi:hypothetical protein